MESFKPFEEYGKILRDFGASAFLTYLDNVIQVVTERGIEAIILVKLRKSYKLRVLRSHRVLLEPSMAIEETSIGKSRSLSHSSLLKAVLPMRILVDLYSIGTSIL